MYDGYFLFLLSILCTIDMLANLSISRIPFNVVRDAPNANNFTLDLRPVFTN